MTEIIVGVDESPGALDALTFASRLALASGASLRLAAAFPYSDTPSRVNVAAYRADLELGARKTLEAARVATEAPVSGTEAIPDPSPARALHHLSERIDAALVVVGSTRRGPLGRVVPGSTGERLLHGSPCPVAIVPRGYSSAALIRTIGVGYDGSDESEAALAAACLLARRFEAALRVIRVHDAAVFEEFETQRRENLYEVVTALPAELDAEPVFVAGFAGHELAAQSEQVDLMVVGSRGYGPRAAVLLGGVTHTLIRKAACPVIVLPRGSHGLEPLFGPTAGAATA